MQVVPAVKEAMCNVRSIHPTSCNASKMRSSSASVLQLPQRVERLVTAHRELGSHVQHRDDDVERYFRAKALGGERVEHGQCCAAVLMRQVDGETEGIWVYGG